MSHPRHEADSGTHDPDAPRAHTTGTAAQSEPPASPHRSVPDRDDTSAPPEGGCPREKNCLWGLSNERVLARLETGQVPAMTRRSKGRHEFVLRPLKFRTDLCKHANTNHCCFGALCWMAHSEATERRTEDNEAAGLTTREAVEAFQESELRASLSVEGEQGKE